MGLRAALPVRRQHSSEWKVSQKQILRYAQDDICCSGTFRSTVELLLPQTSLLTLPCLDFHDERAFVGYLEAVSAL